MIFNKSLRLFVLTILTAILAVFVQAQNRGKPSPEFSPPPMAPNPAITEWNIFKSEKGRFSVLLPTKPTEEKSSKDGSNPHFFHSFMGQFLFNLSYVDWPSTNVDPQMIFDKLLSQTKAEKDLKLVEGKVIDVSGYPGRELELETDLGFMQMRVIVAGNRIYQIDVTSLNKKSETKEARAFLDSFKITDAPGEKKAQPRNSKPN
ncbi:MAG: hypothetical protein ABI977_10460 [Acidobacteriota bacterium]